MDEKSKKIKSIISENRIKLHLFQPSQRKIWTVVGKNKEQGPGNVRKAEKRDARRGQHDRIRI